MPRTLCIIGGLLAMLTGCATTGKTGMDDTSPRMAAVAKPAPDELPTIEYIEPLYQVDVAVEGQRRAPRVPLVAPFIEPTLTEEERVALGIKEPTLKLLLYPAPRSGRYVGSWLGGVTTAAHGRGGAELGYAHQFPAAKPYGEYGVKTGSESYVVPQFGVYSTRRPPIAHGHDGGVVVEEGGVKRIAQPKPRRD